MFRNRPPIHLATLDGFRGCLAVWVYLGHLADATGFANAILARHALAVDLFMVLSGFLIVYSYRTEPFQNAREGILYALGFYKARFFRIAPLYYLLLLLCAGALAQLASMLDAIEWAFPPPWVTDRFAFEPHTQWNFQNLTWIWLHATLLFGVVPSHGGGSPLPDWSLSLEMQFYFAFPLLLLILRYLPLIVVAAATSALALFAPYLFGNYLDAGLLSHFGQPSLLAYRLNAFLAGMIVALWLARRVKQGVNRRFTAYMVLCATVTVMPLTKPVMLLYLLFVQLAVGNASLLGRLFSAEQRGWRVPPAGTPVAASGDGCSDAADPGARRGKAPARHPAAADIGGRRGLQTGANAI